MTKRKGSITVALSLILLTVLGLLFGMLESARVEASRAGAMARADLGLFSFLGEYDSDLLNDFGLFFVDGGYGGSSLDTEEMKDRILKYSDTASSLTDYVRLSMQEVRLTGCVLAGDSQGEAFINEAVAYMLTNFPGIVVDELSDYLGTASEEIASGEESIENADSMSDQIESIRDDLITEEIEETDAKNAEAAKDGLEVTYEPDLEKFEFENPIDTLKEILDTAILSLVPDSGSLSDRSIDTGTVYSDRAAASGWGTVTIAEDSVLLTNDVTRTLVLDEYYLEKLGCYGNEADSAAGLKYKCEYIVCGNDNDRDNLAGVLERILLMRLGMNMAYLLVSSSDMRKVDTVVSSICDAIGLPALAILIKAAIILLWSYEEAMSDIYNLCNGKRVAFVKTEATFHCKVYDIFRFSPKANDADDVGGLSYQDYLRLLMGIMSLSEKTARGMDMVEHEIRVAHDRPNYCIDLGVYAMKGEFDYSISPIFSIRWAGADYTTECSWSYNSW